MTNKNDAEDIKIDEDYSAKPQDRVGHSTSDHDHEDELADEWGDESFPASDPPGHY